MAAFQQVKAVSALIDFLKVNGFCYETAHKIFADAATQPHHAEEVLFLARNLGVQNRQLYELYLNYHAKKGEITHVVKGIDLGTKDKLHRTEWSTYLAHAYAAMGNLHEAWSTIDQIQKHKCQLIPASLSDLIEHSTRHPEFLQRGVDLFHDARREGTTFESGVYAGLLRAMRRAGEVERPLKLLREMRVQGVSLDAMTGHYVLEGISDAGFERAHEVLNEVRLHGVVSDYIAFNKVIQEFAGKGDMEGAMQLFQEMKTEQVKGQTTTYNLLIKGFLLKGEKDKTLNLIQEMRSKQIRMDFNTYLPLLYAFVKTEKGGITKGEEKEDKEEKTREGEQIGDDAKGLEDLLNQMKQDRVEINVHTYNALIDDVARVGGREVVWLFQDLLGGRGEREKVEEVQVQAREQNREEKGDKRTEKREEAKEKEKRSEVAKLEVKEVITMEQRIRKFVAHQLELLDLENQTTYSGFLRMRENLSIGELEQRGMRVNKLRVKHIGNLGVKCMVRLEKMDGNIPATYFSPGDTVKIFNTKKEVSCILYSIDSRAISVAVNPSALTLVVDDVVNLEEEFHDVTHIRMCDAVKMLPGTSPSEGIKEVIFGERAPSYNTSILQQPVEFFSQTLNKSQKSAIQFCLAANEIALIHGPPGTGKTTVVVEFIKQVVKRGERVLVCGPSNMAVDNMLQMLQKHGANLELDCVRIGHPARVLPNLHMHILDQRIKKELAKEEAKYKLGKQGGKIDNSFSRLLERKITQDILARANVVLATTVGVGSVESSLRNITFDWVVIDEAAQGLEAACWVCIQKGKKVVLAGDHNQLPPMIQSMEAAELGLEDTLFEKVIRHFPSTVKLLNIQYRMNNRIMVWASKEMYAGTLVADESVANNLLHHGRNEDNLILRAPIILIDTYNSKMRETKENEGDSIANHGEAAVVLKHIQNLVEAGVDPQEIGVMTPYNAQVSLLQQKLSMRYPSIEVSTVDGFQGREKEAIIVSMVRSNPPPHSLGFLTDRRRMNVALTRARKHVCIVCDVRTVSENDFLKRMVKYFREYGIWLEATPYLETKFDDLVDEEHIATQAAKDPSSLAALPPPIPLPSHILTKKSLASVS